MTTLVAEPSDQGLTDVWLRGLLTVAWADGHFDQEEREIIASLTHSELSDDAIRDSLISPDDLATGFEADRQEAENFLRTAVMVAIADGVYSESEDKLIQEFSQSLNCTIPAIDALRQSSVITTPHSEKPAATGSASGLTPPAPHHNPVLAPVQDWLDGLDVKNEKVAHFLCKMIPAQCPFERDVVLFGRKVVHIPAMCKINPLYEQLVGLRFRALSFLSDTCDEDVSDYI
ncbi:MAG: Mo-dependent nitrogenase C-terminal domain-containing protein [Cyanobacteria bacterium P01_F01_bin.153]